MTSPFEHSLLWTQIVFHLLYFLPSFWSHVLILVFVLVFRFRLSNFVFFHYSHSSSTYKTNSFAFYTCKQIFCLTPVQKAPIFCFSFLGMDSVVHEIALTNVNQGEGQIWPATQSLTAMMYRIMYNVSVMQIQFTNIVASWLGSTNDSFILINMVSNRLQVGTGWVASW